MRYTYKLDRPCSKSCGSSDMLVFTYCCSSTFDVVCQKCGAKEILPWYLDIGHTVKNPVIDQLKNSLRAEVGFVGKIDVREKLQEYLDKKEKI